VVRGKSNSRPIDDNVYLRNPDIVHNYFAGIATDNGYIKSDVLNFRRIDGTQDCGVWNFSDYEVELYLNYTEMRAWIENSHQRAAVDVIPTYVVSWH